jgi:hypothetical protein
MLWKNRSSAAALSARQPRPSRQVRHPRHHDKPVGQHLCRLSAATGPGAQAKKTPDARNRFRGHRECQGV